MFEHMFSAEMMKEREKQLALALLDCTGVYYDINFTQDRIIGNPIQVVDGVPYSILEQIGKPKDCAYSEIIDCWEAKMPPEERAAFVAFSDIDRIKACYARGECMVSHKF